MANLLDQLRAWYRSPTGLTFGVGLGLVAVGISAQGSVRWAGLVGVALLAVAIPRRFVRDRAAIDALGPRLEQRFQAAVTTEVSRVGERLDRQQELVKDTRTSLTRITSEVMVLKQRVNDDRTLTASRLARLTGTSSEIHNRDIDADRLAQLVEYWGPRLDLAFDPAHLQSFLHRVRALEAVSVGRIATNYEDVLIRSFAARAVASETTEICEIGTLFGIGGLVVREAAEAESDRAILTIIDPLAGYYGADRTDPPTGLRVDRRTLDRNIDVFAPGDGRVRVLEGFSTDDAILQAASDRRYDLLVIDGDHSYDGVRLDFERFADLVKPGGILVIDDYGATSWPEVTQYTDDVIMHDERFTLIGAASRTALFRRN